MGFYPDEFLDKIKSRVDIVDLISSFVRLERKGRDYWACCPFHNEKTPSFQVRKDYQYYRCFGCGKSGNIFGFIMEYNKVSFSEAVEILAARAGLELPETKFDEQARKRKEAADKIYDINKIAARFYYRTLFKPEGAACVEYLTGRGIDGDAINRFGLGYSPDFTSLPEFLLKKGYSGDSLVSACVVSRKDNGDLIDFFGKRLIIPVISAKNKVVGFAGRSLAPSPDFVKYKNTGTTAVFNKRRHLFGINRFKDIRQPGKRAMILVEGHMDVIGLYQSGIENVVASMGTSLTAEQCREIKRYADVVYVSFDGDSAGQAATLRGLELLKQQDLEVRVVCLGNGMDPDDCIREFGKEGFEKLLDEALPLIDYKLKRAEDGLRLDSDEDKVKYANRAVNVLKDLTDVEREIYIGTVGRKIGLDREVVKERIFSANPVEELRTARYVRTGNAVELAEKFVLASVMYGKSYVNYKSLFEIENVLSDDNSRAVFDYCVKKLGEGKTPSVADIFDIVDDSKIAGDIAGALDDVDSQNQARYYENCIVKLQKNHKSKELARLTAELNSEKDKEKQALIKKRLQNLLSDKP